MSERHKPHNGRDRSGHFKVKQADVPEIESDPKGPDFIRDDVRLGGAVEDVSREGGLRARHIGELVEENRDDVNRAVGKAARSKSSRRPRQG